MPSGYDVVFPTRSGLVGGHSSDGGVKVVGLPSLLRLPLLSRGASDGRVLLVGSVRVRYGVTFVKIHCFDPLKASVNFPGQNNEHFVRDRLVIMRNHGSSLWFLSPPGIKRPTPRVSCSPSSNAMPFNTSLTGQLYPCLNPIEHCSATPPSGLS